MVAVNTTVTPLYSISALITGFHRNIFWSLRQEYARATESGCSILIPLFLVSPTGSSGLHPWHSSLLLSLSFSPFSPPLLAQFAHLQMLSRPGIFCWIIAAQLLVSRKEIKETPRAMLLTALLFLDNLNLNPGLKFFWSWKTFKAGLKFL